MNVTRRTTWMLAALVGAITLGWTAASETSTPQLSARELPREVLNECLPAECAPQFEFRANWVGRTQRGDLFVVSRLACIPGSCTRWLIEKHGPTVRALLELPENFRFHRVSGRYPAVEADSRHDALSLREHFEWNGDTYARTRTQRIYEVNGVECGTREECEVLARHALKNNDVDRAQRIWQQVHGVSWI